MRVEEVSRHVTQQIQIWPERPRPTIPSESGTVRRAFAGRYRVERELGRGAISTVYLVHDEVTGSEAALKILPAFGTHPAVTPEAFDSEVRINRTIRHPNVVEVLDAGVTEDSRPFVVMERLHGETLGDCLKRRASISPTGALRIVREAARGLSVVHRHDLVHRDVKPDNLFLCNEARHGVSLKILDFGFATATQADQDAKVCGTLEYIAPEQAVAEAVDERADVYALGVVLFRMLTGELPFDACARRGILVHQLTSPIPPPSWLHDGLNESIDRLVQTAVRKHPDNRYSSMEALLQDVDRALAGEVVVGAPEVVTPDRFVARTEFGQRALKVLSRSL